MRRPAAGRREEGGGRRREEGGGSRGGAVGRPAPPARSAFGRKRRGVVRVGGGAGREKRGGERMIGGPRVWVVWMKERNKGRRMREK
jgi:hypothetical protein